MFLPKIYTSESVTIGHPDKVCDQISDAILDECLRQDPMSRVAMETMGGHNLLVIVGEITSNAKVDYEAIARKLYKEIGYTDKLEVRCKVVQQSREIANRVDTGGAGDQGIMYGFASNETKELLPKAFALAHRLSDGLTKLRKNGKLKWLRPDGKTQVTMNGNKVMSVLISTQHDAKVSQEQIRKDLIAKLIKPVIGNLKDVEILINPSGQFAVGGFTADTGLTGRKIMVDSYGGIIPHGGGAFSGKDATKVDRSAAYMCRLAAKSVVASGLAKQCLVSVAYAIGRAEPLMVHAIDEKGRDLSAIVQKNFDFKPAAIIKRLGLRKPVFQETAKNGHFTNPKFAWEKAVKLKKAQKAKTVSKKA